MYKLFATTLTASFISAALAAAAVRSDVAGALYLMSNVPSGNVILSHHVFRNGTISFVSGTNTGGTGSHNTVLPGLDPLASQDPLIVVGDRLFAVNAGSNTFSVFKIDKSNPTHLTLLGRPTGTNGEFPIALAVSPKNGNVCVANTGKVNNVSCFRPNAAGTYYTLISSRSFNFPQTTPPTVVNTFSDVLFSPDGSHLHVTFKAGLNLPNSGYIATWSVNRDGTLSANADQTFATDTGGAGTGRTPFGFTFIPGVNAVVAADFNSGYDIYDFRPSATNRTSGPGIGQAFTFQPVKSSCWSVHSAKTDTFFITDGGTSTVTEISVAVSPSTITPTIVKQYKLMGGLFDPVIATIGRNDYFYVLESGIGSVEVLSLPAAGQATSIQVYNSSTPAIAAGFDIALDHLTGIAAFVKC